MRLEQLTLDILEPDQQALYDAIAGSRQGSTLPGRIADEEGRLQGPFNAMLHYPDLGYPLQELGGMLRFRGLLPARAREAGDPRRRGIVGERVRVVGTRAHREADRTDRRRDRRRPHRGTARARRPHRTGRARRGAGNDAPRRPRPRRVHPRRRTLLGDKMLMEVLTLVGYYACRRRRCVCTASRCPRVWTTRSADGGDRHGCSRAASRDRGDQAAQSPVLPVHGHEGLGRVRGRVRSQRGPRRHRRNRRRRRDRPRQRADRGVRARPCRSGHHRAPRPHAGDRRSPRRPKPPASGRWKTCCAGRKGRRSRRCTDTATTTRPTRRSTVEWRIASCKLTRLRVDAEYRNLRQLPGLFPG